MGRPTSWCEILSPGTAGRDLGVKREAYESASVPEYWIVDPETKTVEVLSWTDGAYARAGLYGHDQTLASPLLPELEIELTEIWAAVTR